MNIGGDKSQIGEVDAHAAGRDIHQVHNDLIEVAGILQQFTDALERQRVDDRHERKDRQREIDVQTAGVQSAINALRGDQAMISANVAGVQLAMNALSNDQTTTRTSIGVVQATINTLDNRTRFVPAMTIIVAILSALTILIIGAVGAILYIILTRPHLIAALFV